MKRYFLFLIILLSFFCWLPVYAEDNYVFIREISLIEKSRDEIVENAYINGTAVAIDTAFQYQDDFVKYKVIVENTSKENDYSVEVAEIQDEFISYEYTYPDVIKAGTKEEFIILVKYKKLVSDEEILAAGGTKVLVKNNIIRMLSSIDPSSEITNPTTGQSILFVFIIFILGVGGFYFFRKNISQIFTIFLIVVVLTIFISPAFVLAKKFTFSFTVDYQITLKASTYHLNYSIYYDDQFDSTGICTGEAAGKTVQDILNSGCFNYSCDSITFHYIDGTTTPITDRSSTLLSDYVGYYDCTIRLMTCLSGEMEVEVYDKKKKKKRKKKLKDVNSDDLLLAWDFDEGCFTYVPVFFIKELEMKDLHLLLTFDDGSELDVVGVHRMFNLDKNCFTDCTSDIDTPIGMRTINNKGDIVKLVSKEVLHSEVISCCIVTEKCFNFYANGLLTSITLNNMYPISDMKYVKDNRATFVYDELNIDNYYFDKLRFAELPRTFLNNDEEETKKFVNRYVDRMIEQNIL